MIRGDAIKCVYVAVDMLKLRAYSCMKCVLSLKLKPVYIWLNQFSTHFRTLSSCACERKSLIAEKGYLK